LDLILANNMDDKKSTPVTIDGVEYMLEDMSNQQRVLLNHVIDLDQKAKTAQFNLDQFQVAKDAFLTLLKNSLEQKEDTD